MELMINSLSLILKKLLSMSPLPLTNAKVCVSSWSGSSAERVAIMLLALILSLIVEVVKTKSVGGELSFLLLTFNLNTCWWLKPEVSVLLMRMLYDNCSS